MKVLFFVDDYGGGAGNVVQILANEFEKKPDITPVVAFLNPSSPNYKLSKTIRTVEYKLSSNKSRNLVLFFWRNIRTVRKIVREVKPDRIISFLDNINTNVCLSLFFNKIPIIVSERSNPLVIKPDGLYRYLRPLAYLRADKISVQCEHFMSFMPCMKSKMIATPNPIIAPAITKTEYSNNGTVKFISCARLAKIKQFDLMIQAFAKIHSMLPNSILTIYGEGPERVNLESLINRLDLNDCVSLPGKTKDIYQVLSSSDIYLMTSLQEGFPNSLCEAMAVGLPVVALKCHDGLTEIVENDINGILVEMNSVDDFINAAVILAQDRNKMKSIGQEASKISKKFSVEHISEIWLQNLN